MDRHNNGAHDTPASTPGMSPSPKARRFTRRALAVGVVAGAVALVAVACGGGGKSSKTPGASAAVPTPTAGANIGIKTPPATISPGGDLTAADLAARGAGQPGRGDFEGVRLVIPKIKVDAPFSYKVVPGSGQMPNPNSWDDVVYYDFAKWPGLGGTPGKGGNIVVAGHVDYIHHGPAVFWDLRELQAGDQIQVRMKDGSTITYSVVFNKHTEAEGADFQAIVSATADESMTLITCTGDFANGHYNERQIVWAKRV